MTNPFDVGDEADNPFLNQGNDPIPLGKPVPSPPPSRPNLDGYRDSSGNFHSFQEMERREAELRRREAEIAALQTQISSPPFDPPPAKNFPPLLRWWSWHPHHDLPANAIPLFTKLRLLFIGLFPLYLLNFGGCLSIIFAPARKNSTAKFSGSTAGRAVVAGIFAIVLVPLSFQFSFFLMYKGVSNGRALHFFGGLLVYGIWFLILIFAVIGFSWSGSIGMLMTIEAFSINYGVAIVGFIFCLGGAVCMVAMGFGLIALIKYYRQNGLLKRAKREGVTMAVGYAINHPEQTAQIASSAVS
jgi:hypothetical protein